MTDTLTEERLRRAIRDYGRLDEYAEMVNREIVIAEAVDAIAASLYGRWPLSDRTRLLIVRQGDRLVTLSLPVHGHSVRRRPPRTTCTIQFDKAVVTSSLEEHDLIAPPPWLQHVDRGGKRLVVALSLWIRVGYGPSVDVLAIQAATGST